MPAFQPGSSHAAASGDVPALPAAIPRKVSATLLQQDGETRTSVVSASSGGSLACSGYSASTMASPATPSLEYVSWDGSHRSTYDGA